MFLCSKFLFITFVEQQSPEEFFYVYCTSSYIAVNLDQNDETSPTPTEVEVCLGAIPSGELTHPTCGKGNTSTQKYPWDGDMLVPRRVLHSTRSIYNNHFDVFPKFHVLPETANSRILGFQHLQTDHLEQ